MLKNFRNALPGLRKTGLIVAATLASIAVIGFLIVPPIVKSTLTEKLSTALHRPVSIAGLKFNPYAMSLTIDGLAIKNRDGAGSDADFVGFEQLYVNVEASSLLRGGLVVGELRLLKPSVNVVRLGDGRYNFSDLVDAFLAQPKSEGKPLSFAVRNIRLEGGAITFDDRLRDEKHTISEIDVGLPFVSNMDYAVETFVEPSFAATVNGSPLAVKGRSKPFASSHESEIDLVTDGLQLAKFADYLPPEIRAKLVSGTLDTNLKLVFRQGANAAATLVVSGTAKLSKLVVNDAGGADLIAVDTVEVGVGSADPIAGKYVIDRVSVVSPLIAARVSSGGSLNFNELYRAPAVTAPAPAAPAKAKPDAVPTVEWSLGEAKVSGGALRWTDESHGKPFRASVEAIEVALKGLSSQPDASAQFDLSAKVAAGDLLKVASFTVRNGEIGLGKKEVRISEAALRGVSAQLARGADGAIEWIRPPLVSEAKEKADRAATSAAAPVEQPWKVSVARATGEAIALRFEDRAVKPAAVQKIEALAFEAGDLSSEPGKRASLAVRFKLNGKGAVEFKGGAIAAPLAADFKLDVKGVELLPLQPYFSEKLNIDVTRGQLAVNGALELRDTTKAGGAAVSSLLPGFSGGFSGQASVANFYAVDKINAADFLRWKSFGVDKIGFKLGPDSLSVGDVALADFFARVIVSAEGKLNLLQIVRSETADAAAVVADVPGKDAEPAAKSSSKGKAVVPVAEKSAPPMPIKIGKVDFRGGSVRFTDNFVKPNYTANLQGIAGSINGLSSEPGTVAEMQIGGNYDSAPLKVTAKINPLSAKPYLDLEAEVKGVEMTPFSSYSGKYAGYAIEKGKLSLFVKYKIENDVLAAENRVFLDQLTFGEAVDSPDATKLPVRLAVSLLKNRAGEIDLNLPISGSLNDPQFSVGGLIVRVIVNLLVKAVTSPFALIGSMFGSSEELSNVEFDGGRAVITAAAQKRLETLAKALVDRPALKLEVEGRYDPTGDVDGLKKARLERKVRAAKRDELRRAGVESGEEVLVSDKEYPALLERVYKNEKFDKPKNAIGLTKSLPVAEMEALLIANTTIDADDLRDLGERRARSVRDYLLAHEVAAERIFLLPSKSAGEAAGGEAKASGARADFALK